MSKTLADYRDVNIVECDDVMSVLPRLVSSGIILLVTSKGFVKRGTVSRLLESLGADRVTVFDDVTPNPEKSHLQRASGDFDGKGIQQVIALGGGSVIDAAKVFCGLLSYPSYSLDELLSTDVVENRINLIAIPTTSGTGAEVTPFATVWQSDISKKYSLYGVRPNTAVLDSSLTNSLPEKQTLYPSLDALSHAIESLWNINSTEQSREYALYAIDLICDNLPLVLNNPDNFLARKNLQIASSAAGMAISITKTAIAHAISYPLTMQFNVPHGLACSFTINSIINIFGAEQLNLDSELASKVQGLLRSLNLPNEIESYVSWDILLSELTTPLDPSRAGNFIINFEKLNVQEILLVAKA